MKLYDFDLTPYKSALLINGLSCVRRTTSFRLLLRSNTSSTGTVPFTGNPSRIMVAASAVTAIHPSLSVGAGTHGKDLAKFRCKGKIEIVCFFQPVGIGFDRSIISCRLRPLFGKNFFNLRKAFLAIGRVAECPSLIWFSSSNTIAGIMM